MRSIKLIDTHHDYGAFSIEILHHNKTNRIFFVKNKQGVTYEVYTDAFALAENTPVMAFTNEDRMDIYLYSKTFEDALKISGEYTVQDDIWPSRRWNKEGTDYIDLSGE